MNKIKFYEFTMEEVADFIYEMRTKKKLSKTSKKIFKRLQETQNPRGRVKKK